MNILHNNIKLKYWKSCDDYGGAFCCWKEVNNNELWAIIMYNKDGETVNYMKIRETHRVSISTLELFDDRYLGYSRFIQDESFDPYYYGDEVLWIDDTMWLTCYDIIDQLQVYISINSKTFECNVYTEVDPILIMILLE